MLMILEIVIIFVIRLTSAFDHFVVGESDETTNLSFCALQFVQNAIDSHSEHSITLLLEDYPDQLIENAIKQFQRENFPIKTVNINSFESDQNGNIFWFYSSKNLNKFLQSIKCENSTDSINVFAQSESINITPLMSCNSNIFQQINPSTWRVLQIFDENENKMERFSCKAPDSIGSSKGEQEDQMLSTDGEFSINNDISSVDGDEAISSDSLFGNDNDTLIVYSLDSPPYMIFEESRGFYDGIEYFALKEIAKRLNLTLRIELLDQAFDIKTLTNYMNVFR